MSSQPSLTKAIASLEAEYDIKLLERTSKGVRMTARGSEFWNMQKMLSVPVRNWRMYLAKRFRSDPEALYCQPTV